MIDENVKYISVYDFDDTLFYTPLPDVDSSGVTIRPIKSKEYENSMGHVYPHKGWWGRKESLDQNIFNIRPNLFIEDKYTKDVKRGDRHLIMMTGRLHFLKGSVESILINNGYEFDEHYYNPGGVKTLDYKLKIFNKLIENYGNLKTIKIYDDRDVHIPIFEKWATDMMNTKNIFIDVIRVKGEKRIN